MHNAWIAPSGRVVRAGDMVTYLRTEGRAHGAPPVRARGKVLRFLVFADHVVVNYGSFGAVVDSNNYVSGGK